MEYIPAKTIVNKTKSTRWFGCDYNMNIYRGCCHGCIYCDSRSECYHIENFDQVKAKENALEIIRNDLRRKVRKGVVGTGAMSDPYNPFESTLQLTRHSLELINAFEFGAAIATKSPLITRDIDVLQDIKTHSPTLVKMTVTTSDDALSKIIEPQVAPSSQRFEAIKKLSDAGIYCGILLMPVLPYITDTEDNISGILRAAKASGAQFVYPSFGMTLRDTQRYHYYNQLDIHFPGLKERYIKRYGDRYGCTSPKAKQLWPIFQKECEQLGLRYTMSSITKHYKLGYSNSQLSFIP